MTHTHTKRQNNWRKRNWKESFVGCCRWISNALHTLHVTRHRPTHTHTFPISPHITPFSNRPQICTIHHARNEWKSSVGWSTDNSLSCLLLSFLFVFLIFHGVALCFPFVSFSVLLRIETTHFDSVVRVPGYFRCSFAFDLDCVIDSYGFFS